tara:strand:+ start:7396 stop:8661 length:1266 start_codon:yes stop_codon:yes gene_type:complete
MKNIKFIIFSIFGPIILVLLCSEFWARINSKGVNQKWIYWDNIHSKEIGFYFRPKAEIRHTNSLDYATKNKANSLGFIDEEPLRGASESICRIAIIGDSFVEAAQVNNKNHIGPILEKKLNSTYLNKNIDVVQFGYSGTGQINQLPFYTQVARNLKPDLVILVFSYNDFADNSFLLSAIRNNWHPDFLPRLFIKGINKDLKLSAISDKDDSIIFPKPLINEIREELQKKKNSNLVESLRDYSQIINLIYSNAERKNIKNTLDLRPVYKKRLEVLKLIYPKYTRDLDSLNKYLTQEETDQFDKLMPLDVPFMRSGSLSSIFEQSYIYTQFAFELFKQEVEKDNSKLIVFMNHLWNNQEMVNRVSNITDSLKIDLINQMEYVKNKKLVPRSLNFKNDGHWNAFGHKIASEQVYKYIYDNKICE